MPHTLLEKVLDQHGVLALLVVLLCWFVFRIAKFSINKMHGVYKAEIDRIAGEKKELQAILFRQHGIKQVTSGEEPEDADK